MTPSDRAATLERVKLIAQYEIDAVATVGESDSRLLAALEKLEGG